MASTLRLIVAAAVVLLLARAAGAALRNRRLAPAVWRRVRPGHVIGALGLLVVVGLVLALLLAFVPPTRFGLGSLIGLSGNAVFAPVEEATLRTGQSGGLAGVSTDPTTDWALVGGIGAFFLGLLLLFPWLAYVEERVFRVGLEDATLAEELWAALRFGLVHLVMLIPIAAALAIGVAGFFYGRVYRRNFQQAAQRRAVPVDPDGQLVVTEWAAARARADAVLASTVWHTTFNSVIVVLLLVALVLGA